MLEEYMLDFGYDMEEINLVKNSYKLAEYNKGTLLYNLKNLINFLRKNGVTNNEIIYITTILPNIISTSIENIKLNIYELNNFCFNKLYSFNLIKKYPYILELSIQKIKNKFECFEDLGFEQKNIIAILQNDPTLLGKDNFLIRKRFKFFLDNKFDRSKLIKVICEFPAIIDCNSTQINKKIEDFSKMGFNKKEFIKLINLFPDLLLTKKSLLTEKFADLIEYGFSETNIINIIKKAPYLLNKYYLDNMKEKLKCLSNLGFNNDDIISIICINPFIALYSKDLIINNFNNIKSLGYSNIEIYKMIKNAPIILSYDAKNMQEKIIFYKSINLGEVLVFDSKVLTYSLQLIKKRYEFMTKIKMIIINIDNYDILFLNDTKFFEKFNITKDEILKG